MTIQVYLLSQFSDDRIWRTCFCTAQFKSTFSSSRRRPSEPLSTCRRVADVRAQA